MAHPLYIRQSIYNEKVEDYALLTVFFLIFFTWTLISYYDRRSLYCFLRFKAIMSPSANCIIILIQYTSIF